MTSGEDTEMMPSVIVVRGTGMRWTAPTSMPAACQDVTETLEVFIPHTVGGPHVDYMIVSDSRGVLKRGTTASAPVAAAPEGTTFHVPLCAVDEVIMVGCLCGVTAVQTTQYVDMAVFRGPGPWCATDLALPAPPPGLTDTMRGTNKSTFAALRRRLDAGMRLPTR